MRLRIFAATLAGMLAWALSLERGRLPPGPIDPAAARNDPREAVVDHIHPICLGGKTERQATNKKNKPKYHLAFVPHK